MEVKNNNNKPNFRLLTDMDDVLENLTENWLELLRFLQRDNPEYIHKTVNEITEWNISQFFPMLTIDEVFEPLNTSLIWDMIRPIKDSVRVLKYFNDMPNVDVRILTSSHYSSIKAKREFLRKYFPYIGWNQLIITSEKKYCAGNVLVDDYQGNLVGGNYKGILFDTPHNRSFNEKEAGIIRVSGWAEAKPEIERMIKEYFEEEVRIK